MGGLFFICIPQIFKPFGIFLRWVGQEDAVFAVVFNAVVVKAPFLQYVHNM